MRDTSTTTCHAGRAPLEPISGPFQLTKNGPFGAAASGPFLPALTANSEKVTTTCEVKDHGWVGSGSMTLGTSLSVITNPVYGTTGITADAKNAIFYLSFDGGSTWQGYAKAGWQTDLSMTESELEDIPKEAYPASSAVQVKVVLENNAVLYALNLNGGRIES